MRRTVELKVKYLGSPHPGQDLCWYVISITSGDDQVVMTQYRAGQVYRVFIENTPRGVFLLKKKLRAFISRIGLNGAVRVNKARGGAYLTYYFPSRRWMRSEGSVSWMRAI
jgi:hypothetical protein